MSYTVVISGSRTVHHLPDEGRISIQTIVKHGATVLIGDAPGGDLVAQTLLRELGYRNVRVFHLGARPRNNVGGWDAVRVHGSFTDRDQVMCGRARFGLALWNGHSRGTGRNIRQLGKRMKVVRAG